jgi:hypothetical protein
MVAMRSAVVLLAIAVLILSTCAPQAAPTAAVLPAPSETPAPSATPAPTETPTRTPTATPTPIPTLPPQQVGGLEGVPDPRYSNPELFDLNDPDAPIPQFVNAMRTAGIEVDPQEVVNNLEFRQITGADGKEYVVASYTVSDSNQTPYTVAFIAERKENGEWNNILPINLERKINTEFGVYLTMYDYNNQFLKNFSEVIFPDGPFSRNWINQHGTSDAYRALNVVKSADAILYLHPGLWHLDIEPKAQNLSNREETIRYINQVADFYISLAFQFNNESGKLLFINFINEPWWADPPNDPVNVGWLNSPYYRNLGEDYITEAYIAFYQAALRNGLKPGGNLRLVISVDGIFFPNKKLDFTIDQFNRIRSQLADRLGIPAEDVPLELAVQWRFDTQVTGPRTSDAGRYKVPTEEELRSALQILKKANIPFHITEFEVANADDKTFNKIFSNYTAIAVAMGTESITYGGLSSTDRNPFNDINHPFYSAGRPSSTYYAFISMLLNLFRLSTQ